MKSYAARTHEEMKDVLMDPNCEGPEVYYHMIRGGSKKRNITIWESGMAGNEYIKTFGHYHILNFNEIYHVLEGEGLLLLQTRKKTPEGVPIDAEVETFEAIKVKAGDIVTIPPFAGHLLINISSTWLVTSDDSPVASEDTPGMPAHADYETVRRMQGFAYYVVNQDGKPMLVRNPKYTSVPDAAIK